MKEVKNCIEELSWQDVRKDIEKVNPKLTAIIDDISPDSSYKMFKASYAFGEEMLREGCLHIPNAEGILIPLTAASKNFRESLSYNLGSNPVSIILSGSAEIYIIVDNHTIPLYGLIPPGNVFSTWKVLSQLGYSGPAFIWNMTAGARSLFMLPKISKLSAHRKLVREFNFQQDAPKNILQHWNVFRDVANCPDFGEKWSCEIAFFGKKWFDNIDDPAFNKLKLYLFNDIWDKSSYWRHQYIWNLVFSMIQKNQRIKASAYVLNIVKHLLAMGVGAVPGYSQAIDDIAGPVKRLKEIYVDVYGLSYAPTIMQPYNLSLKSDRSAYFSLALPNTPEFSEKTREDLSKIDELLLIQSCLKKHLTGLQDKGLHIENTNFFELSSMVDFDFYHTDFHRYSSIKDPSSLIEEDKYFFHEDSAEKFPSRSAFLRGCVRVSKKRKS
jgi:hypothetical protein